MKRTVLLARMRLRQVLLVAGLLIILTSCREDDPEPANQVTYEDPPAISTISSDVAVQWAEMSLFTLRFSAFNTPTYSSRSLGYLGLAMYESVVRGDSVHRSMGDQLPGLELPSPEAGQPYHWILSMNVAQITLLKLLYPAPANSHRYVHDKIDSLAVAIHETHSKTTHPDVVDRSVEFGKAVALAIYEWSISDGGDKGYTRNFESTFAYPYGPSYWVAPSRGQTISLYPLHPHWGENRPFVPANNTIPVPAIVPFSTDPNSEYYKLYKEVYDKDKTLTLEEMEIAAWWGDDPTETFSPPGHSYHIATIAIKATKPDIVSASEAYARVGIAVADAFINCWKVKYTYFNERPSSYVKKYIDPDWIQFWPEPPFPGFPSGHSIHSSASAVVLTELFGESFAFTDDVHEGLRRWDDVRFFDLRYPKRSFSSFWEAANECAYSRFLGGIHTRQDNEVAQELGKTVGANVNALSWRK
jgi:hypothetical protein